MSKIRTSAMSPWTVCGKPEVRSSCSRSKNEARPPVSSNVTNTAAVQRNHSRRSIRPIFMPMVWVAIRHLGFQERSAGAERKVVILLADEIQGLARKVDEIEPQLNL